MSSDLETRIPLEDFHRHFIKIHKKTEAAGVLDELERRAARSGDPIGKLLAEWMECQYPQMGFRDDNWFARGISVNMCYFAHTDFRCFCKVPKNERFVDFMQDKRQEIESGSFPLSSEIRAPWLGQMPEPLVQEREPEKYYVLDGQLRVIRHWYHNVSTVQVFIYRGKLAV
jgi:hypothetical protein